VNTTEGERALQSLDPYQRGRSSLRFARMKGIFSVGPAAAPVWSGKARPCTPDGFRGRKRIPAG